MRTKKSPGLVSSRGAMKLMAHAMMGAALGLSFGLILTVINPVVAALIQNGGSSAPLVFVVTLVTTFAIGATLTGMVFILAEDNES
ncbi:MAG: hypothetical protein HY852_15045 [Bradyrhizobium sp.]|uniref:hypothetical protein n=1 Tax=Bradyrhizobium sp. TaxID=376 RepID=UPI0025B9260C|nr:hypothetical protein [Bradyrhizobium sp.]MBI5263125.1 hypothetical protein [Bradyrhizobium sp.]